MAKRSSSGFNMAAEIRTLLGENRDLSGREVIEALRTKFPKQTINPNSCSVAFAHARRDLGIRTVRKKRPAGGKIGRTYRVAARKNRPAASASPAMLNMDLLKTARTLLQQCEGDASLAAAAIRQVSELQVS